MITPKNILHPTDLSLAARPAFVDALALARKFGATLHMLHVAPTFGEDPIRNAFKVAVNEDAFYKTLRDEMDEKMQAIIKIHDVEGVDIKRVHSRGETPAEVILDYAKKEHMDLIVMGTNGYKGLRRLIVGSVTAEVVRMASCDVLTVRNVTGVPASRDGYEHMLIPVDLTPGSEILLKEATDMARMLNTPVTVLHVVEPFPLPTWSISEDMLNDMIPTRMKYVTEQFDAFVERVLGPATDVTKVIEDGKPAHQIVEYADKHNCDLIVMAPKDRGWAEHLPLGSVAERVMSSSNHPVYLVSLPEIENLEKDAGKEEASATT